MFSQFNWKTLIGIVLLSLIGGVIFVVVRLQQSDTALPHQLLHQDTLINADLWSNQPEILSAGYGFDAIVGVAGGEAEVRAVGGTWNTVTCTNGSEPARNVLTSSSTPDSVANSFDRPATNADGLPVVFSYPVLPSTVQHTDFAVTLNTGEIITPDAAGIVPNIEYNERHVVVIFADFGNRQLPDEVGARYVTRVEVVADATPLMLVGPEGVVSAVGLFKTSDSTPYVSGPYLVGAKLSRLTAAGEGVPALFAAHYPNDGSALYGNRRAVSSTGLYIGRVFAGWCARGAAQ